MIRRAGISEWEKQNFREAQQTWMSFLGMNTQDTAWISHSFGSRIFGADHLFRRDPNSAHLALCLAAFSRARGMRWIAGFLVPLGRRDIPGRVNSIRSGGKEPPLHGILCLGETGDFIKTRLEQFYSPSNVKHI